MKFKVLIILLVLIFESCTSKKWHYTKSCTTGKIVKWYYAERVPKRIQYIEKELSSNLGIAYIPDKQFYVMYTLIAKKNDVGIYAYKKIGPHLSIHHVFMYNGDTVVFTNIEDSLIINTFIKSNSFSKQKIKKINKKIELFNRYNENVNKRW